MSNYEKIHLEKGMYGVSGKSFTQLLEELDPSDAYQGCPGGAGRIPAPAETL